VTTIAGADNLCDLIEIDLLFAHAELATGSTDRAALIRAVRHLDQALKNVRAYKSKPNKPKLGRIAAA